MSNNIVSNQSCFNERGIGMVNEIAIGLLLPHPETSNYMAKEALLKLRRNIEFAGCYEPLVVRIHPQESSKYQVIHGHNRLRVLKAMGDVTVKCILWDIDDEQTRIYLAVMNRVSGSDIPERRAMLLEQLLQQMAIDDLAALLLDKKHVLEELEKLAKLDIDDLASSSQRQSDEPSAPVIINCMMEEAGVKSVDLALDLIIEQSGGQLTRGKALVELSRRFLQQCVPNQDISMVDDRQSASDNALKALPIIPIPAKPQDGASVLPAKLRSKRTTNRPSSEGTYTMIPR